MDVTVQCTNLLKFFYIDLRECAPRTLCIHGRLTVSYKIGLANSDMAHEKLKIRTTFPQFFQKCGHARPYFLSFLGQISIS